MLCRQEHEGLKSGEGSWNVAWDAWLAHWLHHPDLAWLLFGICPLFDFDSDVNYKVSVPPDDCADGFKTNAIIHDSVNRGSSNYRVTGVPVDVRCLLRAIAHMACLRNGGKAPDENCERELADELRAQVVEELLKRRKEVELFIEEDFDEYVKRIKKSYVWVGEPELLMASHVLRGLSHNRGLCIVCWEEDYSLFYSTRGLCIFNNPKRIILYFTQFSRNSSTVLNYVDIVIT